MKSQTDHVALEGVKAVSDGTSRAAGGQEATEVPGWKRRSVESCSGSAERMGSRKQEEEVTVSKTC